MINGLNLFNRHLAALLSGIILTAAGLAFVYSISMTSNLLSGDDFLIFSRADALPQDISLSELKAQDLNWTPVNLPFHWRNQFTDTHAVWYRLKLSREQIKSSADSNINFEDNLFGLYIWRLNQTADIWFNGTKIGSGGRTSEPMARYWNSPLYFSISPNLIQNKNEILIKHFAQHNWGSMESIVVGQESNLKPVYNARYFIQHDVALGLFVFVLVTGLFSLAVWFYRRRETEYFWFFIASAGLSFFCLNQFIRYLPMSADSWRWLSNITTDMWAVSMYIFVIRSLNISTPKIEKVVFGYFLSGIPIYFYASFYQVFDINIFYHIGSLLIGAYGFYLCLSNYLQTKRQLPAFYVGVIAVVFIAGTHDIAMQAIVNNGLLQSSNSDFQNDFNFLHFAAPLIFLVIGASLIKRFIDSMNAADSLNEELEQRIEDARQELNENYQAIEKVLIKQSASEERERIYRDLHDDVGSKLLSLYYRLDNESDSTLAKSALEDLRDIVSRKSLETCSLAKAVQQWKSETFARTQDAGVALTWQYENGDSEPVLDGSQYTQLRRMIREVISNAILHSTCMTKIITSIAVAENYLTISIINDGTTNPASSWETGRGISNLRVRSRDLQGEFCITDLAENCVQVSWKVPLGTT